MKKGIIALSVAAAMATSTFGSKLTHDDLKAQIDMLKKQIEMLESKIDAQVAKADQPQAELKLPEATEKRIKKIEKKLAKNTKKINKVKAHDAGDNIKWNVDFRTQMDHVNYKTVGGGEVENSSLLSNRLWLGMKFKADDNTSFYGTLSYNKLFGDNRAQIDDTTTNNNAGFDWVTNEAASNDNSLKVKEAYWLYRNDSFMGNDKLPWTASIGRRPSTDGLGINLRVDQQRKSALSHTVNVEFDGASVRFDLDQLTGVEGMWVKFCGGRGLTNAKLRFSSDGLDYTSDTNTTNNVDMAGLIFVPYDDGQYSVHTNYAQAWNLIGNEDTNSNGIRETSEQAFKEFGNMEFATIMFKADGIGEEISEFLDNSTFFASYAMSKTNPNNGDAMLGSTESKIGHSYWVGLNMPAFGDDDRFGLEWNRGSRYWRSMTYGEDTMIGSKIAARGTAWEAYYNSQLTKALSGSLRFTKINYDYTGSNGFFGDFGAPSAINTATGQVKEATNITGYIRYRF